MTAHDVTRASSENSGGRPPERHDWRSDPDAQRVVQTLDYCGDSASFQELQSETGFSKPRLSAVIDSLSDADAIDVVTGMYEVHVSLSDPPVRADGGQRTRHPSQLDMAIDDVCHLLNDDRRRLLIRTLAMFSAPTSHEEYISVDELATVLAAVDTSQAANAVSDADHQRMYNSLTQTHLDTLADCDLIDYYDRPQKIAVRNELHQLMGILIALDQLCVSNDATLEDIETYVGVA